MSDWTVEYKTKVRAFMELHGSKINVESRGYSWERFDDVSTFGWNDYDAYKHTRSAESKYPGDGCRWIVPEGAVLYERSYSQFNGTDADNSEEMGVNVKGCRCACGKYEDVILRWTGSVAEMLHAILDMPNPDRMEVTL